MDKISKLEQEIIELIGLNDLDGIKELAKTKTHFPFNLALERAHAEKRDDIMLFVLDTFLSNTLVTNDRKVLIYFCEVGNIDAVRQIASNKNIHTGTLNDALLVATDVNNTEIVKCLVNHGAEVDIVFCKPLRTAAANGNIELLRFFIDRYIHIKPGFLQKCLVNVISAGSVEGLKYLVEEVNVDVNADNNPALYAAAKDNNFEMVKYLIEHGADIPDKPIRNDVENESLAYLNDVIALTK